MAGGALATSDSLSRRDRAGRVHFRHNLTTLELNKFSVRDGDDAGLREAEFCATGAGGRLRSALPPARPLRRQCRCALWGFAELRAWSSPVNRCPKAAASIMSATPIWSAAASMSRKKTRIYSAVGVASWYGEDFHGRGTANGEIFDANSISAAHPTLPLPSYARVTNLGNGRSIIVRVNDRGPYAARPHSRRVGARGAPVGFHRSRHRLGARRICRPAPIAGSDDRMLEATLRENGPAPAPSDVMMASNQAFPPQPAPVANQRIASAAPGFAPPPPSVMPAMSYAAPPGASRHRPIPQRPRTLLIFAAFHRAKPRSRICDALFCRAGFARTMAPFRLEVALRGSRVGQRRALRIRDGVGCCRSRRLCHRA